MALSENSEKPQKECGNLSPHTQTDRFSGVRGGRGKRNAADPADNPCASKELSRRTPRAYHRQEAARTEAVFRLRPPPVRRRGYGHFWRLVLAITIGQRATIGRLTKLLRGSTHRTKQGEFLWKSLWDESWVVQEIVLDTLRCLDRPGGRPCYFIIDDTQALKQAKKMAGAAAGIGFRGWAAAGSIAWPSGWAA